MISDLLIIDCQTTAIQPDKGHILQLSWCIFNPNVKKSSEPEQWILKLPDNEKIPLKIKNMLGISDDDYKLSVEPIHVFNKLQKILQKLGTKPLVLAHYAQFEYGFLKSFYQKYSGSLPDFTMICSQKMARRLLPNLPSYNLNALAGYFKLPTLLVKNAASHVTITKCICQHLFPKLISQNITNIKSLSIWLNLKNTFPKKLEYIYNIERLERLKISSTPGIYRMLAVDKTVLYIGKATSLKTRVNSYFQGLKNKDKRKQEMLMRVWDIETIECETPLEAELLESDEIKRWNPPYNILLKNGDRKLIFYNRTFTSYAEQVNSEYLYGPFKIFDAVMYLFTMIEALKRNSAFNWQNEIISADSLQDAWNIFCATYHVKNQNNNFREVLCIGFYILRAFEKIHGRGKFEKWWLKEKIKNKIVINNLTMEAKLGLKILRSFIRGAEAMRRSSQIRSLYNSKYLIKATQKKLNIVNGNIMSISDSEVKNDTCKKMEIHQYDRLIILLSAKNKNIIIPI